VESLADFYTVSQFRNSLQRAPQLYRRLLNAAGDRKRDKIERAATILPSQFPSFVGFKLVAR
jgi:hypothetical protein